jgi:hypothetical protein
MAKRKPGGTPIEDQLRDFEQAPGLPKNLGNFPDELDPDLARREAADAGRPPKQPEPEPEPEPDDAPPLEAAAAESEEQPEPQESDRDRRLAELEERLAAAEREREFLRAGYQQGQQAAQPSAQIQPQDVVSLVDQYMGTVNITEADAQQMQLDPARFVEFAKNGLRAAAMTGAAIAIQQLRAEYSQLQQNQMGGQQLRQWFYGQNPDLEQYDVVVGQYAQAVRNQYPSADAQAIANEAGRRTRAWAKERGIKLDRSAAPAQSGGSRNRVRPAQGEMGGGARGGGGNRALSPIERQLRDFEAGTNQYLGR